MRIKKQLSFILSVIIAFSVCVGSYPVHAAIHDNGADAGLCPHHLEHTAMCGYEEAVQEQPCTHTHDASCGYLEAVEEVPCDMECTDTDGDGIIDHAENCAYRPAAEEQPCTHQHDDTCGYVAPVEGSACSYADHGCPYCVVSWEWVDHQQALTELDGSWGLGLPGASGDHLVTRETLTEMLPAEITAVTDSSDSLQLAINWDLSAIPEEGAAEGEFEVSAALADEAYALTEHAPSLSVKVQAGGGEDYSGELTLPSGTPPYQEHIVDGVSPNGTTINLFDYWTTNQTDSDFNDPGWRIDQGINHANSANFDINDPNSFDHVNGGHALLFAKTENANQGDWNKWTGSMAPKTGIVQDQLGEDGYPHLNIDISQAVDSNIKQRDGNESLAYLFDPTFDHNGKRSYEDVYGLLRVDDEGYYYYNSQESYAAYYADTNTFTLYEYPGVKPGGSSPVGQFFPFNAANADAVPYTKDGKNYTLMNDSSSISTNINHYFGIHMSTRFIQQNGGHTDGSQTPVTYEFSGDDDVWIFIDGKLVVDLGGIHNAAFVHINFATGDVYINDTNSNKKQDGGEVGFAHYTLGEKLGLSGSTFPDNTYHTLDFFYLERGNTDSNLRLKYNLVTIPESSVIKVDQLGDPVAGAEFTLYGAADYEKNKGSATPIATGITDNTGEFVFLKTDNAGNSIPITINELYDVYHDSEDTNKNNLVLVETKTPAGYRTKEEVGLYFYQAENTDEILLLSNSVWDKGAYAMPKVTTTTSNSINLLKNANDTSGTQLEKTVTLVGNGAVENPLMFAVVFQKQTDDTWLPVSGDLMNGWHVQKDSKWDNILSAAQENPYIFQLGSSGAYQVEIDNLPGDIRTYYHICKDLSKTKYTIAYYYTEASSLSAATAANTWRIDSEASDPHDLDRVFSVNLYITNIKNYLLVQKVDEDGTPVNGAQFSLYQKEDVTVNEADGTVSINKGAEAYDTLTTKKLTGILNLDGGGAFPTADKDLVNGEYYLIETDAPVGYKLNKNATHVIVDHSGVYADAGNADDGISVLGGVGSVIRSMLQFAADDDVDTTLNSIKAAMATNVTFHGYQEDGSFTVSGDEINWDSTGPDVLHLRYENANKLLDYGLYDDSVEGTIDNLTLATQTGWSKLLIQQCYQHDNTVDTSLKTNLAEIGYSDITDLFSGTVTVRVSNDQTGNLKIGKTVTGEGAPVNQAFTFTVTVQDDGTPISGTYETLDSVGTRGSMTFQNGQASVTLKNGEHLTILALPAKAHYTVTENNVPDRYTPSVTVKGDDQATTDKKTTVSGTIPHHTSEQEAVEVQYTNTFNGNNSAVLKGTKTLQGRPLTAADSFSFELTAGDAATEQAITNGKIEMPTETTAAVTGNGSSDSAEFFFEKITFTAEGTYTFQIAEKLPAGVNEANPISGEIWYDTSVAKVTVTVTRDTATGILQAEVSYQNESDSATTDQAVFTNLWANLLVSKTVSGNMGDRDKLFDFELTLTDAQGTALTGSYRCMSGTTTGTLALDQNGTAEFELKHGENITIFGLPAGSRYRIYEPGAKDDGYTVKVTVGADTKTTDQTEGTLSQTSTVQVAFENQKEQAPGTGVYLDCWPWLTMMGLVLAFETVLFLSIRRSRGKRGGKHRGR